MNERIAKLYQLGNPRELKEETNSIGWHDCLQYGFTEDDIPELIKLLGDEAIDTSDEDNVGWVALYAWRTLGQLRAVDAIEPIVSLFNYWIDVDDDWALSEIHDVMGMIGVEAIDPLTEALFDEDSREFARIMASDSLASIAKYHPEHRDKVIEAFRSYTSEPDEDLDTLNGLLISSLIDLKAVELIDDIREMFKQDYVDITVAGDIEDVEIALGLRDKRETPKPNYSNFPEITDELLKEAGELFKEADENEEWSMEPAHYYREDTYIRETPKVGRNDPCPCGSGKKYKKCCLN